MCVYMCVCVCVCVCVCCIQTVLCPHKVYEEPLVLQLPLHTSHLKITRPLIKVVSIIASAITTISGLQGDGIGGTEEGYAAGDQQALHMRVSPHAYTHPHMCR